jgi:NAD+ diphosphatase
MGATESLTINTVTDMNANCLLFVDGRLLLNADSVLWPTAVLADVSSDLCACLSLSDDGDDLSFAAVLSAHPACLAHAESVSVRQLLLQYGFDAFSRVGRASQLVNWYQMHRHCGRCGARTRLDASLRIARCDDCQLDYYPRINPCVIVLVTHGRRILLARSVRRGATFFSCLAGFIEPGETAEQAVAREVYEEVGIRVRNVRYVKSQPWPFPSQLMLGFYADYAGGEIRLQADEIAEAHWYDVGQLPETPASNISVAGQLIEEYCVATLAGVQVKEQ